MNNFLVAIAGFICTVLLAAIFAPYFIDWNSFKAEIELAGSKITGQNVQIVGDVELRILPQPVFHTGGLIITNGDEKKLLETNDFKLELDFPSLLRGKVEVTNMYLNDGKIFVTKAADTQLSLFNFGGRIGQPIGLDDISIKKLLLNNMEIEFANDITQASKTLSIKQAEVTARTLIGPFKIKGQLNVDANESIYQRNFIVSMGKFAVGKPLSVKVQIEGQEKGSRLSFLGNLVGLEKQPLLIGQLEVKGRKGEDLIGYGQSFGSVLSDDLNVSSDLSINYSGLDIANIKISMGSKSAQSLSDGLKINGNLSYKWGQNASINGALNIGIADFNYIKRQFLTQDQLDADQPVYQSMMQLSDIVKNWMGQHVIVAPDEAGSDAVKVKGFKGNISVNIDQLSFEQNGIVDRVRLISSLIDIDNNQISLPQFSAHFPGNSKLSYTLSRQSIGQGEENVMTGQYEFTALHFKKLTNWLLFKNQQTDNIGEFWGVNDQILSQGNVDLLSGGINISSPLVKTKKYQYALNYAYENGIHDIDVSLGRIAFDNGDIRAFQQYIGAYAQKAFVAPSENNSSLAKYHFLPQGIIEDIGEVKLSVHGKQSFYGIRDLGVFDAKLAFKKDSTTLEEFNLIGDKLYITAIGNMPHKYAEKDASVVVENKAILEFSIIDADTNVTPQLVHDLLFVDNLFLDKAIPNKGALNVTGKLNLADEAGDLYLDITGKIGSSELDIGIETSIQNGLLVQKSVQYQLTNANSVKLLSQYELEGLLTADVIDAEEVLDGVVRFVITKNATDADKQDIKLVVVAGDQTIELDANAIATNSQDFNGQLHLDLNGLGIIAQKLGLFEGNFNRFKGHAKLDATIEIVNGLTHISSKDLHILNTDFNRFNLDIDADNRMSFAAQAEQFYIANLLSFLSGENENPTPVDSLNILNEESLNALQLAQSLLGNENDKAPAGFGLKMLQKIDFNGVILVDKLFLSDRLFVKNAEILVRSDLAKNNVFVGYSGTFFNTKIQGEFVFKPIANQLSMDATLRTFALDVEQLAKGLRYENQYLAGLVNIAVDLTGQGYSVEGLLSNLAGTIDLDLKGLSTSHIDAEYFNREINTAVDLQTIDDIFINFIIRSAANDGVNATQILPEKLSFHVRNGLAAFAHEVTFQKPNLKAQKALLSGQLDLTSNASQFTLQIPLSDELKAPKILLEWLSVDGGSSESLNFEALQEYYIVKLLEKNVKRLEELQVEIKRKNDAELARYQQEKFEALAFKNDIRVRVEKAIDARKMREMVAKNPPIPRLIPYIFVAGTAEQAVDDAIEDSAVADSAAEVVNSNLTPSNIVELSRLHIAALRAAELLAAEKATAEAKRAALDAAAAAKKLAEEEKKLLEEFPDLEFTPLSDDEYNFNEDIIVDGGGFDDGFDSGNLSETETKLIPIGSLDGIDIQPLPDLR